MRRVGLSRDELFEFDGIDEFDPVIAPEISALVVPVIRVAHRIAFLGIDDERTLSLGESSVRENVDALVADQPQAGSGLGFRGYSPIRDPKAAVCGRVGTATREHGTNVGNRESEHATLPQAASASGR
ncbi:hypothetical protein D3C87_1754860 [compost metagenome]